MSVTQRIRNGNYSVTFSAVHGLSDSIREWVRKELQRPWIDRSLIEGLKLEYDRDHQKEIDQSHV